MRGLLVALVAALALTACGRSDVSMKVACAHDSGCPSGYHCGPASVCLADVPCQADGQCCLAQRCVDGYCRRRQMCSEAAPCGGSFERCVRQMCVPSSCKGQADCAGPSRCIMGFCRVGAPCGGHCAAGAACAARLNKCVPLRAAAADSAAAAAVTCAPGYLAVLKNEIELFDEGCATRDEDVACEALPPLPEGQYGLVAAAHKLGKSFIVLARDRTYGDLVVARHDTAAPHARSSLRSIAGVPLKAPVIGAPDGPRSGIGAPGPDVADALAITAAPGGAHVLYHDVGEHRLRYLSLDLAAQVSRDHEVASGLGRAIATSTDDDGKPWVAVFVDPKQGDSSAGTREIRLLSASNAVPEQAQDWSALPVWKEELGARAASPIGPSALRGRGAQLAMAVRGATATIAAYSADARNLVVFRRGAAGKFTSRALAADAFGASAHDHGRFPSLVLDAQSRAQIACQDVTRGRLLLIEEQQPGGPLKVRVLDDGIRADGHHRVGAATAIAAVDDGGVVVAYQDARTVRPLVIRLAPGGQTTAPVVLDVPGGGFANSVLKTGLKSVVVATGAVSFSTDARALLRHTLVPVVLAAP